MMNTKYLPLCFLVVAILVAFSLWSIYGGDGVRLGIDLSGGYKLVYEVNVKEGEPDVVGELIRILKERIDPTGLSGIEWRPMGRNRFEVRMPAGKAESRQTQQAYLNELNTLKAGNIQRSSILALCETPADKRAEQIQKLSGTDTVTAGLLEEVVTASDAVDAARAALKQAPANQRDALEARLQEALSAREALEQKILERNVRMRRLESILANWVAPTEKETMAKNLGSKELERRKETFRDKYKNLIKKYPDRKAQIDAVVIAYQQWAGVRRYLENPDDLKRLIAKAGVLEFRIAPQQGDPLTQSEIDDYRNELLQQGPDAGRKGDEPYQWFLIRGEGREFSHLVTGYGPDRNIYVLLSNNKNDRMLKEDGNWSLASAYQTTNPDTMGPAVGFEFDARGASRFAALTATHINKPLAILLDDVVYSAPAIRSVISSRGTVTGNFSQQEVQELVRTLDAGSLPARLNPVPVAERTFAPSIGEVNARLGKSAAVWGLAIVAAFMLVYYLRAGFVADIALVLNIIFVVGFMSLMDAVLTLPGIAGLILTIGIAVDANVLIYERLREEQAKGLPVRTAVKNAYQRAFSAIFDANLTTLITCLILAWVGTEEIRGFAITLMLGIVFSMFTALVVTRWIFQAAMDLKLMTKPITMLHIIGVPAVDWMKKRYAFWVVSVIVIVLGLGSLIDQGKDVLGIELSAGTEATLQFKADALIDGELSTDALVYEKYVAAAKKLAADPAAAKKATPNSTAATQPGAESTAAKTLGTDYTKLAAGLRVIKEIDPQRVEGFLKAHDRNGDDNISATEWAGENLNAEFFKKIDANGDGTLTRDELDANLPERTYQVSTTETQVALIRTVAREAFGDALDASPRLEFERAKGRFVPQFNTTLSGTGMTKVTDSLVRGAPADTRATLADYLGGVMYVVDLEGATASESQILGRLRQIRMQPDFTEWQANTSGVIGLLSAGPGEFSSLAVLVKPADEADITDTAAWEGFARGEQTVLTEALHRAESIAVTSFDAQIAGDAQSLAIVAILLSCLAIVGYLWLRFGSIRWGLAAVVCLVHDVLICVGLVAASVWISGSILGRWLGVTEPFKIDLALIAAFLTVIGYSVNDTIVVFDRIRENRGKLKTVTPLVINNSINQTLSRTLLTSGTTFMVVFIMYVWGGPGIHAFNYALLVGIIFGTYSSIAIASPLLLGFKHAILSRGEGAAAAR